MASNNERHNLWVSALLRHHKGVSYHAGSALSSSLRTIGETEDVRRAIRDLGESMQVEPAG